MELRLSKLRSDKMSTIRIKVPEESLSGMRLMGIRLWATMPHKANRWLWRNYRMLANVARESAIRIGPPEGSVGAISSGSPKRAKNRAGMLANWHECLAKAQR